MPKNRHKLQKQILITFKTTRVIYIYVKLVQKSDLES